MIATVVLICGLMASALGASFETRLDTLACGNYTMTEGTRLVIQSPNFPKNYPVNQRCQWEFSCPVEADNYLDIICPKFALQSSKDCVHDRLIVTSRGQRDVKCGTDSPDGTKTSTGWARFTFFSNAAITNTGFRCYIWCHAK
ncbi:tolloid-like protein 2 [Hyalella azteca]|uniref:Tolloid-like protein 2 n=1 Tax=Hyalella azteca TaxID=294128 RepID=A0A8B7NYG4_HYAAZ|nr:tolloid-like protein 2 [Hyalella azteca]